MRQEIKFRIYPSQVDKFFAFLYINGLKQCYKPRTVNSIYYDSFDYETAQSNLSGELTRRKFRLRWYNSYYPPQFAKFELKEKYNKDGLKRSFDIDVNFEKNHKRIKQKINIALGNHRLLFEFYNDPKSLVRYHRKYFMNESGDLRVTLDSKIEYVPQLFGNRINVSKFIKENPQYLIELKYENSDKSNVEAILSNIPFTNYRNSKYVQSTLE